jgi:hypothetical protein
MRFVIIFALLTGSAFGQLAGATVYEKMYAPNGSSSQTGSSGLQFADGYFQVDGVWVGTGNNTLEPTLASFSTADPTSFGGPPTGYMNLKINNVGSSGCPSGNCQGSEIISNALPGYGYGYYEVRMAPDYNLVSPGGVASFFLIQAGGTLASRTYGPTEFDFEFLLNQSWASSCSITTGAVQITTHPSGVSNSVSLPFNPACGYHRYGFLWVSGNLGFYADGTLIHTVTSSDVNLPANGMWIMANTWTGDASFGGGPPASVVNSSYDYIKFWPGATSVQNGDPPTDLYAKWSNFPQSGSFFPLATWSQTPNRTQGSGALYTSIPLAMKGTKMNILEAIDNGSGYNYPATPNTDTSNLFADMAAQGIDVALIVFPLSFVNTSGAVATFENLYPFNSSWNGTVNTNNTNFTISSATSSALTMTSTIGTFSTEWLYMITNSTSNGPAALVSSVQSMASGIGDSANLIGYIMGDEPQGGNDGCTGLVANIPTIMTTFDTYDTTRPFFWNHTDWPFVHGSCSGSLNQNALKAMSVGSFDLYPMISPFNSLSGTTLDANGVGDYNWIQGWSTQVFVADGTVNQPIWVFVDTGDNALGYSSQGSSSCNTSTNVCTVSGQDPHYYRAPSESVNAEVWNSIINGAVGVEWFCDDIGNKTNLDFCLGDGGGGTEQSIATAIAQNITYIDTTLLNYAPQLNVGSDGACTMNNGTTYTSYTTSCSNGILTMATGTSTVPGSAMVRNYNGTPYLFADSDRNGSASMTFTLAGYAGYVATVVYDSNAQYDPTHSEVGTTFTLNGSGQFSDTFGANGHNYQPKIYTITPSATNYTLTVTATAGGSVTDNQGGIIACTSTGGTCTASYSSGTVDVLTATPSGGYSFTGWSGACTGTGTCSVTMSSAQAVTATFSPTSSVGSVVLSGHITINGKVVIQ